MNKNLVLAFLLSFIPGLGHFYLGRKVRAVLYGGGFFGPLFLLILLSLVSRHIAKGPIIFMFFIAALVWVANMLDMVITLAAFRRIETPVLEGNYRSDANANAVAASQQQNERFFTIVLSFIPGLGHFQMGLMQRGLTFLVGFFGLFSMIVFVSFATHMQGVLVFLLALPVIVLYSIFDAIQLLHRRQRGEEVADRSIFDELEQGRVEGRKSKMLATFLSIFPGAGHLYLGLQRRGLQLMAAFLLSIYILDALRLTIFLFLIPIIWFYSLFDALQQVSKHGKEEMKDIPLVDWLMNHQKWIGIALLLLGGYYLLDQLLLRIADQIVPEWRISFWFHKYFQIFVVSTLLIFGGIKLIFGSKSRSKEAGR